MKMQGIWKCDGVEIGGALYPATCTLYPETINYKL